MPQFLIPVIAFVSGVFIQMLALLRTKPGKGSWITFFGFLVFIIFFSILRWEGPSIDNWKIVPALVSTFSILLITVFAVSFFKDILRTINEATVFSVTLSLWILVFSQTYIPDFFWFYVGAGIVTLLVLYTLYSRKNTPKWIKGILYFWFLFVNIVFAAVALIKAGVYLPNYTFEIFKVPDLPVSQLFIRHFLEGMITVIVFSYLAMGYVIIHSDSDRKYFLKNIGRFFTNYQLRSKSLKWLLFVQLTFLYGFHLFVPYLGFETLLFWVLITPVIARVCLFAAKKIG